eukprot:1161275-Pelagomonas_calceolata.AAC.8
MHRVDQFRVNMLNNSKTKPHISTLNLAKHCEVPCWSLLLWVHRDSAAALQHQWSLTELKMPAPRVLIHQTLYVH